MDNEHKITKERLYSVLPSVLREDVSTSALGEAAAEALAKEYEGIDLLRIYATIDRQPENVVDLLAEDLRTQYYDVSLPLDTKRALVKNTVKWYKHAGTLSSMQELIDTIFGASSSIEEWFDYAGTPGHFRIDSDDIASVFGNIENFEKAVHRVKRLSAHLDGIYVTQREMLSLFIGIANEVRLAPTYTMEAVDTSTLFSWFTDGYDVMLLDGYGNILIAE